MADNFARTMQFEYKMNSNLVLTADRSLIDRRSKDEPTGEVLPIKDVDPKAMGSKVLKRKPECMAEKQIKRIKRDQSTKNLDNQLVESVVTSNEMEQQFNYIPKTTETKSIYEAMLNMVNEVLPDADVYNITQQATDELLTDLKNSASSDKDKKRAARDLLGSSLTDGQFANLMSLASKLTDYKPPARSGRSGEGVDDNNDLPIIIDDDREEEENDMYGEVQDSDNDEDGVEADASTTLNLTQSSQAAFSGGAVSQVPGTSTVLPSSGFYQKAVANSDKLNPNDIDAFWLQRTLSKHFTDPNECQKRTRDILEVLKSAKTEQELENQLMRLVGKDRFDLVRLFRQNRFVIYYCTRLSSAQTAEDRNKIESEMKNDSRLNRILVDLRNLDKKDDLISSERTRKSHIRSARIQADIEAEDGMSAGPNYGAVEFLDLKNITFSQGSHLMTNQSCKLPDGSYRKTRAGYNVVAVPAPKPRPLDADENLVKVVDLPSYVKSAFQNVKTLNRIQSRVYHAALETDENLLLCAPTGAGKTNVALLCMMREIGKHINTDGTIRKNDFKIIYIAPMKSLVNEMTNNFSERLKSYNLRVAMLSGDSNLSREEINETQIIVCTPEKWDVISRKSGEKTYTQLVKLMIIDEIHLLHDERGPALEAIVARTIRAIDCRGAAEMRIIGLSATLPNDEDIAEFIRVDKQKGLFKFDSSYRPVPMEQEYLGINERKAVKRIELMNDLVYEKVMDNAGKHQVLIFVHSRKETVSTAKAIKEKCLNKDTLGLFLRDKKASTLVLQQDLDKVKNHDLKDLLPYGFAIHHAGLAYTDRNFVEELFTDKHIQVLVSTSTLAWGVNLPAHVVIIKGTQVYRPDKGEWTELSALDVMQMFGRAGRPQYDTKGVGIMITNESELTYYLSLLNEQLPIESQFISKLADNLNAEIVMGTVRNIQEAIEWLRYSYLYIRMRKNPSLYGVEAAFSDDPTLENHCKNLIYTAASILEKAEMINFDKRSGEFLSNEIGRVAAHYYCSHETMDTLKTFLKPTMSDIEVFRVFSKCNEFRNITVREEDKLEIKKLLEHVPIPIKEGPEDPSAKVNCLLQAYISQLKLDRFTLSSDTVYISQSAARLMRAMFEVCLSKGWAGLTETILETCKEVEQRMWACCCPLRQFKKVPLEIIRKLEKKNIPFDRLVVQKHHELGELVNNHKMGKTISKFIHQIPKLDLKIHLQPITRSTMKVELKITPDFEWCPKSHGSSQGFWIFVEDVNVEKILHYEYFLLKEKFKSEEHILKFFIPIFEPLSPVYYIRAISDRWIASETEIPIILYKILLPDKNHPLTELLDLQRLPIKALRHDEYESIYRKKNLSFFNAIQTQCFESLYNSDENVFIGAPTGSGKTVCGEFAIMRLFSNKPDGRCVYVTALEELAEMKYRDWCETFGKILGKSVTKLTGNTNTDNKNISKAHIIVSTAENWDVLSRRWKKRKAVQNIQLFIVDDLHLLGSQHNGTTLEIVCSRTRYMSSQLESPIRIVGLSYSLINARDVGEWLDCQSTATYNFNPNVRHRPLEIEIITFNIQHNATRLAAMGKPIFQSILRLSPSSPSIVFVPTMKQTEEISFLLMGFSLTEKKNFSRLNELYMNEVQQTISNEILIETVNCGVGFLHEALSTAERELILKLFSLQIIQILVVSHSLCWAIPSNAHLVVIADTQVYNGKDCMYDDYSAVDLIQMVGRANNTNFEDARAVVLCQSNKREFIQKFLHDPLPLESHLDHSLHDHFNAEIVTKTIENKQDAVDYLTWTFFYHRMTKNPHYYNLKGVSHRHLSDHLSELVENTLADLENSKCIAIREDIEISAINLGMIAAFYYIRYTTIEMFSMSLKPTVKVRALLELICNADEFGDLPLRHGEDVVLSRIKQALRLPASEDHRLSNPRTKANILLQAHLSRVSIKAAELREDLNQVLMKSVRLIQACVDVLSSNRWLSPALQAMELAQIITQAQWHRDSLLKQIPHFDSDPKLLERCEEANVKSVFDLMELEEEQKMAIFADLPKHQLQDVARFFATYPNIDLTFDVSKNFNPGGNVLMTVKLSRDKENIGPVHAPHFPYKREESWWLVVGEPKQDNLISIKLLSSPAGVVQLNFEAPRKPGLYEYTLYFMSDSYLGCDQEYPFSISVG